MTKKEMSEARNALPHRIERALDIAFKYGDTDGAHHKTWVIDQMVRRLLADPDAYAQWVAEHNKGEDGPDTYEWDKGIAP